MFFSVVYQSVTSLVCSPLIGRRLRRAAPTQTLWAQWAASRCTTPAQRPRRSPTARSPARSCCCSPRPQSALHPPPPPPTPAAAAAVSGTRLLLCLPPRPPHLQARPPPHLPRPWSTISLHKEARPTSPASYPSPRADLWGTSPLRRARACTTASWRSPTASASCRQACCLMWGATRLLPPWTRRAGVWEGITSSRARPPRTPATTERKSGARPLKSKTYLKRKNKTWVCLCVCEWERKSNLKKLF